MKNEELKNGTGWRRNEEFKNGLPSEEFKNGSGGECCKMGSSKCKKEDGLAARLFEFFIFHFSFILRRRRVRVWPPIWTWTVPSAMLISTQRMRILAAPM